MENLDEKLYEEATERVNFKRHLRVYIAVMLLSWGVWFFTRGIKGQYDGFWPAYATLGWGFGVLMHYWGVYKQDETAVEKEVEKLRKERKYKQEK